MIKSGNMFDSDYRVSRVVAEAPVVPLDAAEDVCVERLKLPEQAATVKLKDYLVDDHVREGYLKPSTLSTDDAVPFDGRVCNRLPPKELPRFVRELDRRDMLAAVRRGLGKRSGFFCVRKSWDEERQVWILRLVLDRRPRNAEETKLVASEDTVPHGTCFTATTERSCWRRMAEPRMRSPSSISVMSE